MLQKIIFSLALILTLQVNAVAQAAFPVSPHDPQCPCEASVGMCPCSVVEYIGVIPTTIEHKYAEDIVIPSGDTAAHDVWSDARWYLENKQYIPAGDLNYPMITY